MQAGIFFHPLDYSPSKMGLSGREPVLGYSGKSNPSVSSPMEREISRRSSIRSPHSGLSSRESPSGDGGLKRSPAMVEMRPNLGGKAPHSPHCDKKTRESWDESRGRRRIGLDFQKAQLCKTLMLVFKIGCKLLRDYLRLKYKKNVPFIHLFQSNISPELGELDQRELGLIACWKTMLTLSG